MGDVMKCQFSGSFFPGEREELRKMVENYLDCGCQPAENAVGIVVPHAGYIYSGRTAGYGFASAPDDVSTVVVCAPSHRFPLMHTSVFHVDGIETPLGICPVNREITGRLAETMDSVTFHEHSLEVMVPFIQVRWPDAAVVPVVMGMSPDCRGTARLVNRLAPDSLFVASSDLSHFHPLERARVLDEMVMEGFLSLSPEILKKKLESGGEACGRNPILTLLYLAELKKAARAVKLDYSTSADAGAGTHEVVGYFSGLVS